MWEFERRLFVFLTSMTGLLVLMGLPRYAMAISVVTIAISINAIFLAQAKLQFDAHWRTQYLDACNVLMGVLLASNELLTSLYTIELASIQYLIVGLAVTELLLSMFSALMLFCLPVPTAAHLKGQYKDIATTSFTIPRVIEEDAETTPGYPERRKEMTVQCWFPVSKHPAPRYGNARASLQRGLIWTSGYPEEQYEEITALLHGMSKMNGMPLFSFKHFKLAKSNSVWHESFQYLVSISQRQQHGKADIYLSKTGFGDDKLPIAIYSHGMYGWRQIHHGLCENLASCGYVVFACDHEPDSLISRPFKNIANSVPFLHKVPPNATHRQDRDMHIRGASRRVADLASIIEYLKYQNDPDTYKTRSSTGCARHSTRFENLFPEIVGHLDLQNIHLWGHSYGGCAVTALCSRDPSTGFAKNTPSKSSSNNSISGKKERSDAATEGISTSADSGVRIASAAILDGWMYPLPDEDRIAGAFATQHMLFLSAECWEFGKYQDAFRRDFIRNSNKATSAASSTSPIPLSSNAASYSQLLELKDPQQHPQLHDQQHDQQRDQQHHYSRRRLFNLVMRESVHHSFCDINLMAHPWVLAAMKMAGKTPPHQLRDGVDSIVLAYFARTDTRRSDCMLPCIAPLRNTSGFTPDSDKEGEVLSPLLEGASAKASYGAAASANKLARPSLTTTKYGGSAANRRIDGAEEFKAFCGLLLLGGQEDSFEAASPSRSAVVNTSTSGTHAYSDGTPRRTEILGRSASLQRYGSRQTLNFNGNNSTSSLANQGDSTNLDSSSNTSVSPPSASSSEATNVVPTGKEKNQPERCKDASGENVRTRRQEREQGDRDGGRDIDGRESDAQRFHSNPVLLEQHVTAFIADTMVCATAMGQDFYDDEFFHKVTKGDLD